MDAALSALFQRPAFAALGEPARQSFLRAGMERSFAAGAMVQWEGDPCPGVYWVLSGEARVLHLAADGRELALSTLRAGDVFNLTAPFVPSPANPASVRALTPLRLWFIAAEDLLALTRAHADLSLAVMQWFARHLSGMNQRVEMLSLHSVRGRLARLLLDQADGKQPQRRLTQDEMAESIGTVRDMVGRTLRGFEEQGYLRRDRGSIVLLDRAGLEAEAAQ